MVEHQAVAGRVLAILPEVDDLLQLIMGGHAHGNVHLAFVLDAQNRLRESSNNMGSTQWTVADLTTQTRHKYSKPIDLQCC